MSGNPSHHKRGNSMQFQTIRTDFLSVTQGDARNLIARAGIPETGVIRFIPKAVSTVQETKSNQHTPAI